ncbi:CBO0543 family protein [Alicyclobacillus ferrooxydans]|uniref:Uncharacterized protein n=1 Tax=Alicyclobacillus ferrooxydans TaxID=471514 RepID=A0A0P9EXE3_9BACL|nr:hypothetical protein AN477_10560 [Alicyclobacillus ferrooxydans]
MIIVLFSLLFLVVLLLTRSYRCVEQYYSTILYISLMSVFYTLICTNYGLWTFRVWWIFTNQAVALLEAVILFPSTTALFLRYLPRHSRFTMLYFILFVALYIVMEYIMIQLGEIRYTQGWNLGWSTVVDVLMFLFMLLHERSKRLTWILTVVVVAFFIRWFDVPLFAL